MKLESLIELINNGREIEFIFNNKKFSITYGIVNNMEVISFCEYYKESTEVNDINDLLNVKRDNKSVKEMWESLTTDDIWIY